MAYHNRLTFVLGLPVVIFVVSLYTLWTMELCKVLTSPVPVNFRDPKDLGLMYEILAPLIYSTCLTSLILAPVIMIFIVDQRRINKKSFNPLLIITVSLIYSLFFGDLIYLRQTIEVPNANPLSALNWFLD
jgi:hypothetical protein